MIVSFISKSIAFLLLVILFPLILVLSFFSVFFQGFPIFFVQKRIGFKYDFFNIYKFRTMVKNNGNLITNSNDSRVTKWGRILRYFKLDEIPQLFNILNGDMRFVGPRPEVGDHLRGKNVTFLNKIKPGITDFSSILLRNESQVLEKLGGVKYYHKLLDIKVELGHIYCNKKTFFLDLKLVFITLISIINSKLANMIIIKLFISNFDKELQSKIKNILN